jgi:hypothetical protein
MVNFPARIFTDVTIRPEDVSPSCSTKFDDFLVIVPSWIEGPGHYCDSRDHDPVFVAERHLAYWW